MLGIFDRVIRTSTRTENWGNPPHNRQWFAMTEMERMQLDALRQREVRARDMGLIK